MTAVFGTGREAGADEDDFHTFKRKNVEVDREVQSEEKSEVEIGDQLPVQDSTANLADTKGKKELVVSRSVGVAKSYKGYENGIRKRLKMDADERPKVSLWVSSSTPVLLSYLRPS